MLFLLVSYSPLARRQVRASIYPVSRASAWLVVAAPAPPKPTKTRRSRRGKKPPPRHSTQLLLNCLAEDRVLDQEKEHYPRAFTDGEITYES